jgi:hypothetical protein
METRRTRSIAARVIGAAMLAAVAAGVTGAGPARPRLQAPAASTAHAVAPAQRADDLGETINRTLGLAGSTLVTLDLDLTPSRPLRTTVTIDGRACTLDLVPHSIRAPGYRVLHAGADGRLTPVPARPVSTLRGTVLERPGSVVAASVMTDGLHAMVDLGADGRHWIEPAARHAGAAAPAGADGTLHVVYRQEDVIEGGTCAAEGRAVPPDDGGEGDGAGAGGGALAGYPESGPDLAELACDADYPFWITWGASTEDRINAVINQVNIQYERDVAITHLVTTIIIRTSPVYSSTSALGLLQEFRQRWVAQHLDVDRDLVQLFSGRELDGGTIGIAWDVGQVCTSGAYCLIEADWSATFGCITDLSAHELGHIWGAEHCSCPSFTMNPFILCNNVFSTASRTDIGAHRDSLDCLNDVPVIDYCDALSGDAGNEHIAFVAFADINQPSGGSAYTDFTLVSTEVALGSLHPLTVTLGGPQFPSDIGGAWIDWNADKDFDDALETLPATWAGPGPYVAIVTVPEDAVVGPTRMRVRLQDGLADPTPVPCGITAFGEVEDYTVFIVDPCPGDVDGDGAVDFEDLVQLLFEWGPCPGCPSDLDHDDEVDFDDLVQLLFAWGPC